MFEKLAGRRVIVFVDDIDRVRPDLVPDLLLTLRETLDQPDFFYVMALAPDVVQRGLRMVHRGWGSASEFLEKIIEYPRHLPQPTERDLEVFIDRSVAALGDAVNSTVLRSMVPLLPRNPRKLKLYLRLMASFRALLVRFDAAELDAVVFHLAQLLRSEFPEETRHLINDEAAMEDLRMGWMLDHMRKNNRDKTTETAAPSPAKQHAPHEKLANARFQQLYDAIRNRDALLRGRYSIVRLFTLSDEPPAITWRELNEFLRHFDKRADSERRAGLSTWLSDEAGVLKPLRIEAAFYLFIEMRQESLAQAADAPLDEDRKNLCAEAQVLGEMLRFLIVELGAFRSGAISIEAWKSLLQHVQKWGQFTKLKEYVSLRTSEAELLKSSVATMPPAMRAQVLDVVGVEMLSPMQTGDSFALLLRELREQLQRWGARTILEAFASPDALDALLTGSENRAIQSLLMLHSSPLYTDTDMRQSFMDLAARASSEPIVQRNFTELADRILYVCTEGGRFSTDDCRKILADEKLIQAIWGAAVATPLNARTAGGLRLRRNRLISEGALTQKEADFRLKVVDRARRYVFQGLTFHMPVLKAAYRGNARPC